MDYLVYILIVWFTWPFLEDPNWSGWATESIVLTSECDINRVIKYPFMQLNFSNDLHMHKLSIWSKLNNQILSFSSNMCLMQWKWKKYMSDLWGLQRKCYKLTSFASSLNTFFGSMVQCPTGVISIFHFQQNIHFSFKKKGKMLPMDDYTLERWWSELCVSLDNPTTRWLWWFMSLDTLELD